MRPWSAEDAQGTFEIYGDARTAEAIGRCEPVRGLAEMRELLGHWNLQSSQSPLRQAYGQSRQPMTATSSAARHCFP